MREPGLGLLSPHQPIVCSWCGVGYTGLGPPRPALPRPLCFLLGPGFKVRDPRLCQAIALSPLRKPLGTTWVSLSLGFILTPCGMFPTHHVSDIIVLMKVTILA